jgi:CTP:molybdopterin cytidylyltransferase MocA
MRLGCVVLAAGGSRRLGRPKQLVLVEGEPLVRRAALAALSTSSAECAVVVGALNARVSHVLRDLPLTVLHNAHWQAGMGSSIALAANWARVHRFDGLLLSVCDQPRLDGKHLRRLVAAFGSSDLVAASFYAGVAGVPALFPERLFNALAKLEGEVGASRILRQEPRIRLVPWPDGALDIDTPEQLGSSERYSTEDRDP